MYQRPRQSRTVANVYFDDPDTTEPFLGSVDIFPVIPAKAGIQGFQQEKNETGRQRFWIPAFAGMTVDVARLPYIANVNTP